MNIRINLIYARRLIQSTIEQTERTKHGAIAVNVLLTSPSLHEIFDALLANQHAVDDIIADEIQRLKHMQTEIDQRKEEGTP